jgi:hypothetical protein
LKYTAILTFWIGALSLAGYYALAWAYKPGMGRTGVPKPPEGNGLHAVILVHPDCPCTEATLKLFSQAVRVSGRSVPTIAMIPGSTRETNNVSLARSIPNSRVEFASPEKIYGQFKISTSGHVLVWSGHNLVFSGGVTDGRGEDVMAGSYRVLAEALKSRRPSQETPVFGCAAFDKEVFQ